MTRNTMTKSPVTPPRAFASGVIAPFRALSTVGEIPGLKRYFIIPFILNVILLAGAYALGYMLLGEALYGLLPQGDAWYLAALRWVVTPLLAVILLILVVLVYSITGSIVTAPFNDLISAKVEKALTGRVSDGPFSIVAMIDDIIRILFNTIKLVILLIVFNVVILVVNFIPLAGGPIYTVLSFSAAMFFLGFQFFDFPLERRRLYFKDKLSIVLKHKFTAIGLGTGLFLISFVPLVGFLGLNLAAVGGTELFVRRILPALEDE